MLLYVLLDVKGGRKVLLEVLLDLEDIVECSKDGPAVWGLHDSDELG